MPIHLQHDEINSYYILSLSTEEITCTDTNKEIVHIYKQKKLLLPYLRTYRPKV